jgi:proton-translocating NADH-quinone oxidoreductase chain M
MTLIIMIMLVLTGVYIFAKYGVTRSSKAEALGLGVALIALTWAFMSTLVSYWAQNMIIPMLPPTPHMWGVIEGIGEHSSSTGPLLDISSGYRSLSSPIGLQGVHGPGEMGSFFGLYNGTDLYKGVGPSGITGWVAPTPTIARSFIDTFITLFDGLTIIFVCLTVIIIPISIVASEKKTEMIASLLVVEALLIGAFVTYDFITFYALFEAVLIPMFFLIGGKGSGVSIFRINAAYRLFLYTLLGSVLMLLGLILLYLETGTLNWYLLVLKSLYSVEGSASASAGTVAQCVASTSSPIGMPLQGGAVAPATPNGLWIFPLIFIAFAVKVPMIPVHLWLPEAHTIAPTPGSMILAALLLKLGGYGILRWLLPLFPGASLFYMPIVLVIATISTLYACLTCLRQIDVKRIVAYSSIVHMNICIFSIFTLSPLAIKGAIFEMFSHGIISTGMFFLIGVVYNRHDTRILKYFRGLVLQMPLFTTIMFIFILANSAVPLTCGFIGEFIMLSGSMGAVPLLTVILTISTVINAGYNIWLFNRMCFGGYSPYLHQSKDLTRKEFYVLAPLLFYIVFLGVCPNFIFMFIDNAF